MLKLEIPDIEFYDEKTNSFLTIKGQTLQLEHSLVSLSKWESKWNKPFLSKEAKTSEETIDYIRYMTITQNVNDELYKNLPDYILEKVNDYIASPMTATTFSDNMPGHNKGSAEIITAEIIYYWMVTFNIPFECQKWHLNRLLTLIKVCSIKNTPQKKMSKSAIQSKNAALNASRRKALNSRG